MIVKKDNSNMYLQIYGVSSKLLTEYTTSDKDLVRKIKRIPNTDYLLDIFGTQSKNNLIKS
jgi:hypothetical protein